MMRRFFVLVAMAAALSGMAQPEPYEWTSQSRNASESMPCGGGDVGMNVWVEQGDVLFYLSRSGCFDENNTLLKLGRFRVRLSRPFGTAAFRQQLVLADGYCLVSDGQQQLAIWADVGKPVVHVEASCGSKPCDLEVTYENWRTADRAMSKREGFQSSWKFAMPQGTVTHKDSIAAGSHALTFLHRNGATTIFDATVSQQGLDSVKSRLYNPLKELTFGGRLSGDNLVYINKVEGRYASTSFTGWVYRSAKPARRHRLQIVMATVQGTADEWQQVLDATAQRVSTSRDRKASRRWWNDFWQRSYIEAVQPCPAPLRQMVRNYALFRYMLGCNARGEWPTKFNGGLFTFDPEYVNAGENYRLTPDFRNWGGGVHTAQNQRLVYWPLLKSGDYDLLQPQLDFYLRLLGNAELRSEVYWHHGGACFTEQTENYGLPCYPEYGTKRPEGFDPGMERNAWLEYEWDTCLEFCMMALEAHRYGGMDIARYEPLITSCLTFFAEHYKFLARQRGAKTLDGNGHLVLYPGSGGETFKGAYNSTSTIAALRTVAQALQAAGLPSSGSPALSELLDALPPITVRDGQLQPALHWERVQNVETTQLYPVFPWRIYGVGRPGLDVARKTYEQDSLAVQFRSHVGWKQDAIWAACLGLTDEAERLTSLKLADGPYRFPAFWGPGFDWSPDHNWGGSGMAALQEMLLQEAPDGQLLLFPAWPSSWNVRFRLHASGGRVVEAEFLDGKARLVSHSKAL